MRRDDRLRSIGFRPSTCFSNPLLGTLWGKSHIGRITIDIAPDASHRQVNIFSSRTMSLYFDQGAPRQHLHHFLALYIYGIAAALKLHLVYPTSF